MGEIRVYLSILIPNLNDVNTPITKGCLNGVKKQDQLFVVCKKLISMDNTYTMEKTENDIPSNNIQNQAGASIYLTNQNIR
jgi:hypothetical protein